MGFAIPWPCQAAGEGLDEARALAQGGDLPAALAAVQAVLEQRPGDVEARMLLGVLLGRDGRSDEAIATFRALAAERPELPETQNNLAVLYAAQGRYDDARVALLEALRVAPDYTVAHENLGDVYAKLAALSYSRAARADPGDARAAGKQAAAERLVARAAPPPLPLETAAATAPPPSPRPGQAASAAPGAAVEIPAAGGTAAGSPTVSTHIPAPPRVSARRPDACVQVHAGDPLGARRAAAWLRARGLDARVTPGAGVTRTHRVIVPPLPDRESARREAARLQAAGIADLMLISAGDYANGISLGVYANEDGARRRVRALAARGVSARIAVHDVRAAGTGSVRLDARGPFDARAFAQVFPDLRFEVSDCPP